MCLPNVPLSSFVLYLRNVLAIKEVISVSKLKISCNWKERLSSSFVGIAKYSSTATLYMLEYLSKKSKNVNGVGFAITQEAAVADTRERPYRIDDVKNESGARKYKTIYQIVDKATGKVLAQTDETKAKAKEIAKALYTDKGFKGDLVCTYTKQVVDGEPTAFTATYTPSKSSRVGSYLVFGIERG